MTRIAKLRHRHVIPPDERDMLAKLKGHALEFVRTSWVEVFLRLRETKPLRIRFEPGLGASPADPREELIRLAISEASVEDVDSPPTKRDEDIEVGKQIAEIWIATTIVVFGNPEEVSDLSIGSVEMGRGVGYSVEMLDPDGPKARSVAPTLARRGLLNEVDVGVLLTFSDESKMPIATNGTTSFVDILSPEGLADLTNQSRLSRIG